MNQTKCSWRSLVKQKSRLSPRSCSSKRCKATLSVNSESAITQMITVVQVDRKDAAVRKLVLLGDARIKTGDPISAVRIRGCNVHFPNNLRSRRLGYLLNFGSKGCAYTSKFNVCIFELTNAAAPQRKHPWQVLPNDVGNHRTLVVLEGTLRANNSWSRRKHLRWYSALWNGRYPRPLRCSECHFG